MRIQTGTPDTTPEDNLKECEDLDNHGERLDEEDGDLFLRNQAGLNRVCALKLSPVLLKIRVSRARLSSS